MLHYQERATSDQPLKRERANIPVQLKNRVEQNTAVTLDDVRVHYNSHRPDRLGALAYTQGTEVYLGPGQERHLPHELGHVVQQKLGLVRPDTLHESGARMNTDPALERQADRIGAGRERFSGYPVHSSGRMTVQRMAIYEGMDGNRPVISRYKRNGHQALQELKKYFTEESIQKASMDELAGISREKIIPRQDAGSYFSKLTPAEGAQGAFEYAPDFEAVLLRCIEELTDAGGVVFTIWNKAGDQFESALERCKRLIHEGGDPVESENMARTPLTELERRGSYQKVEDRVDPYDHYKKQALYCIAQKASTNGPQGESVGPHIAITVIGKRIYIANNTHFAGDDGQVNMRTLMGRVRAAINDMRREDILPMMRHDAGHGVRNVFFELQARDVLESRVNEIMGWIEKIRSYPISVLDAPGYRGKDEYAVSPIHGEMTIMDYMRHHAELFEGRGSKLQQAEDVEEDARGVIWIGGTRVDCIKCHEHFGKINDRGQIRGNYVVSSEQVGTVGAGRAPFPGTEGGTDIGNKKNNYNLQRIRFKKVNRRKPHRGEIIPSVPKAELDELRAQVDRDTHTDEVEREDERMGALLRDMNNVLRSLQWEDKRKHSGRPYGETGVLDWARQSWNEFADRMEEIRAEAPELAGVFNSIFEAIRTKINELLARL